jgi:hypothetical protein
MFLADLFHVGDSYPEDDFILRSFPKLLDRDKLRAFDDPACPTWGIALVESFNNLSIVITCFTLAIVLLGALMVVQVGPGHISYAYAGMLITVCSLLLFGLYRHTIVSQDTLLVAQGVEMTSSELGSVELSRWLQITVKHIRRGYSIWSRGLSFIVPWLSESRSPSSPEAYTEFESALRQHSSGSSSRPGETQRGSSNSSALDQRVSNLTGRDNLHDFNFGFNANDNEQEDDGSNGGSNGDDNDNNDDGEGGDRPLDDGDEEAAHLFLHLIVPSTCGTKEQIPIKVTSIETDYDLLLEIIRVYRNHCGFFRALFMVDSLRPTQYELFNKKNVRTWNPRDLAETMPDIVSPPPEYTFSYLPVDPQPDSPLLHPAQLTALFYNPNSSRHIDITGMTSDEQVYARAPKRKGILRYKPNLGYPKGYGFEFVERFNYKFVIKCELLIILLAFLLGGLYWGFVAQDEQRTGTAMNIGMFVIAVGQVVYVLVLGLTEWLEAWRY